MNAQIKSIRDQILEYLQGKPPQSVGEIARALMKEASNVHRVVKDLMDAGLIIGEAGPSPHHGTVYSLIDEDEDGTLDETGADIGRGAPARDPTNPGRSLASVPPLRTYPSTPLPAATVCAPQPIDPAPEAPPPEPQRRQRRTRVSSADFMKLFADLSSDSEKLQRIRSILEE